jgi:trans-aconitate 2-methyltransferase
MTPADSARDMWNPERYERFQSERERPFADMLALVGRRPAGRVADLGCGTGALTARLHEALGATETVGIDSSAAMLQRAHAIRLPGLRFVQADMETWAPAQRVDVLFSNAALQWVDGHPRLFARLADMLAPDGQLAVQVPANHDHPSHTIAAEVAREQPFAAAIGGYVRVSPVLEPEAYAELLHELGFAEQHVRMQVYGHLLDSTVDLVEWVRGTLLTDYAVRMPDVLFEQFVARYRERLLGALGERRPYFFAFRRILLWAGRRRTNGR